MRDLWLDDTRYDVRHASRDKDEWLVTLEGVADRDAADALRGRTVVCERADVPVAEDELWSPTSSAVRVVDVAGATLGEVTGSFDSGAHEVLEVRGAPAASSWCRSSTPSSSTSTSTARRIVCDPPEGLIDLEKAA